MNEAVKIVECPRDAWQGLPAHIPPEMKAAYLRDLIDAGFKHIDAVSFVSPDGRSADGGLRGRPRIARILPRTLKSSASW